MRLTATFPKNYKTNKTLTEGGYGSRVFRKNIKSLIAEPLLFCVGGGTEKLGEFSPASFGAANVSSIRRVEEVGLICARLLTSVLFDAVLSIELRRNRLDLILKQNLSKGLSHALQRALNDSTVHAQVSVPGNPRSSQSRRKSFKSLQVVAFF